MWRCFALACLLGSTALVALADDAPFPPGNTSHRLHDLKCSIVMPEGFDVAEEHSLVVILHGAGGTETGMAGSLQFLVKQGYVVLAPKSRGPTWAARDLADVRAIVADLKTSLNIGANRLHGAGFSNGGWNLAPVAFDEDLRFTSACWIAAGFNGGKVPKHAKKGMGALALVGAEDPNRGAAEGTPRLLDGKVRSAEVRIQANLGHKWPQEHMEYYGWWMGVQEGRFVPGATLAFSWKDSQEDGLAALEPKGKAGGFAYWFAEGDAANEQAKSFQNEAMQHPLVRHYGGQLTAWKMQREENEEEFAALKLKATPAVVVYDAKGKVKKMLAGKIKAKSLASALRSVARNKKPPE